MNIPERDIEILRLVGDAADELGLDAYAVGGYVRDCLLQRPSKDIDFVTVGSGIELARAVSKRLGRSSRLAVFKNFGRARARRAIATTPANQLSKTARSRTTFRAATSRSTP